MVKLDQVAEKKWFHAIDFGEFASSGRFEPGRPQNFTLYGVFEYLQALNLNGAAVLDIGTYDGITAFGARALGAKKVCAMDTFKHDTFLLARELLGYGSDDIAYYPERQIQDLDKTFDPKTFDVIVCAGVIYHMLHPMQAFTECRKVLKDGGVLIMETPFEDGRDDAALLFNGTEHTVNEPYTYFVPTRAALTGMANLSGFRVLSTRILKDPRRITLALKSDSRENIAADPGTPPFVAQMLKRDTCDDSFRYADLEETDVPAKPLGEHRWSVTPERMIVATKEQVNFPHHPPSDRPIAGTTRFENPEGNTKLL